MCLKQNILQNSKSREKANTWTCADSYYLHMHNFEILSLKPERLLFKVRHVGHLPLTTLLIRPKGLCNFRHKLESARVTLLPRHIADVTRPTLLMCDFQPASERVTVILVHNCCSCSPSTVKMGCSCKVHTEKEFRAALGGLIYLGIN